MKRSNSHRDVENHMEFALLIAFGAGLGTWGLIELLYVNLREVKPNHQAALFLGALILNGSFYWLQNVAHRSRPIALRYAASCIPLVIVFGVSTFYSMNVALLASLISVCVLGGYLYATVTNRRSLGAGNQRYHHEQAVSLSRRRSRASGHQQ